MRSRLQAAGRTINSGYSELTAFRKLFISERRDWTKPNSPRIGWKRGEFGEVFLALIGREGSLREEWGDVAYYAAQSYDLIWWLYAAITPPFIIKSAVEKFEHRAEGRNER